MLRLVHTQHQPSLSRQSDTEMDESILLGHIAEGDAAAFELFYKMYYPRLFRFILRMTRQPESVEELIQETLLVVWEKPHKFNHDSKISTWIFGIAYHKALKSMSRHNRRRMDVDVDELKEIMGDPGANPAQHQENADWLNTALAVLSPEQRAVIELTFYHGLAYQDIAKILNCPEGTVKTRMFHARKKLQFFAETQER
ncbi:sigma-70 family RNA polymerase sigma factor [Methylomonas paludis]|uniref:RNA polymerase sigma factor n=1 Tax=Methylomonas paludis TaxID=1173101 RepID=A0A975MQP8_9GAMM|nr:sigma-70 family RNA polymerase sigma factor [Methylomonas paludis]QWF72283.1 sigma-70 family RNA polymerase sigma factor [Methylomonas paludis]